MIPNAQNTVNGMLRALSKMALCLVACGIVGLVIVAGGRAQEHAMESTQALKGPVYISMDLQDASLRDVLKLFSQQSGLNFVAASNVEARAVTLYMEDVLVQDALDHIIRANDLVYEQSPGSDIFIVRQAEAGELEGALETRIYTLKFARLSTSLLQQSAASIAASVLGQMGGLDPLSTTTGGGGGTPRGIDLIVTALLSEDGSLITDEQTNSLIVTDNPEQLNVIESVIEELDVKLPQILIEAEVLETTVDALNRLGVTWGDAEGALLSFEGAERDTAFPFSNARSLQNQPDQKEFTFGTLDASVLNVVLRALLSEADTRILARPRIIVMNNESALVRIITDAAVGLETTTSTEAGTIQQEAERAQVGVSMVVTPQINSDGYITMAIEPAVVGVVASGIAGFFDPRTRGASTLVRVKDGQTVFFAGLISKTETITNQKVPILGDLPLVGGVFRDQSVDIDDTELVIFVTPRIIPDLEQSAWLSPSAWGVRSMKPPRPNAVRSALRNLE